MSFQFISNPTGASLSDTDFVTSALDQPMSAGSTFWDQAKGGALESFGLGTAARSLSIPEAAPADDGGAVSGVLGAINRAIDPAVLIRRAAGTTYDGSEPLTKDQYETSPSFRKDIPYQQGMTPDRAAALAEMDDRRKVRDFYGQKRPVTSFIGNLAGSAIDPLNYIPVAGEAVVGANVARFGQVGGRAVSGAIDAAGNAALGALVTAPTRTELGDDTSWQSTVSQIAMAGLIGGAFGALHGKFGRDVSPTLKADAENRLATLNNVQTSRVALNDAIDGMINNSEVNLSPASSDMVARVADQDLPKVVINRMAREAEPGTFDRLDALNKTHEINQTEIARLQSQSLDNEKYGQTRGQMIQADQMAERLQSAEQAIANAPNDAERAAATVRRDAARQELRDHLSGIDDNVVKEIENIDDSFAARRAVAEPVATERAQLQQRADQLFAQKRDEFWQNRFAQPDQPVMTDATPTPGTEQPIDATQRPTSAVSRPSVDNFSPPVESDPAVVQAAKRVARPEASREMAEQFRVNPETGEFPEMADIEQLRASGRLTEDDLAALDTADETVKSANAYSEALKSFASCTI